MKVLCLRLHNKRTQSGRLTRSGARSKCATIDGMYVECSLHVPAPCVYVYMNVNSIQFITNWLLTLFVRTFHILLVERCKIFALKKLRSEGSKVKMSMPNMPLSSFQEFKRENELFALLLYVCI